MDMPIISSFDKDQIDSVYGTHEFSVLGNGRCHGRALMRREIFIFQDTKPMIELLKAERPNPMWFGCFKREDELPLETNVMFTPDTPTYLLVLYKRKTSGHKVMMDIGRIYQNSKPVGEEPVDACCVNSYVAIYKSSNGDPMITFVDLKIEIQDKDHGTCRAIQFIPTAEEYYRVLSSFDLWEKLKYKLEEFMKERRKSLAESSMRNEDSLQYLAKQIGIIETLHSIRSGVALSP